MPRYSGVTFSVQPVEKSGKVAGFVVAGFVTKKQLAILRRLVDDDEYQRTRMWRGEYQELARAIVHAIDQAVASDRRRRGPSRPAPRRDRGARS